MSQEIKTTRELARLHAKAVDLMVLLEATHAVMPDDKPEQSAPYRLLVGMAFNMADSLQEEMDKLGVSLHLEALNSHIEDESEKQP